MENTGLVMEKNYRNLGGNYGKTMGKTMENNIDITRKRWKKHMENTGLVMEKL